jgi:hypothetical protein
MNYNNSGNNLYLDFLSAARKEKKVGANLDQFKRFYSIQIYTFDKYINTLNPENLLYLHHGPTS